MLIGDDPQFDGPCHICRATPLNWSRDVTELLKMYLRWNPEEESLQMCLHRVVETSNRAQRLNEKAAAALHVARQHVRGNINRAGAAREWGEDEKLILDAYDALVGYSEAPSDPNGLSADNAAGASSEKTSASDVDGTAEQSTPTGEQEKNETA